MPLIHLLFQTTAPVDAGATPGMGDVMMQQLLFIVPLIAIFYFLLIRPQSKRAKQHREMLGALKKGDMIITQGGIIAKIIKIADNSDEVQLDTGEGGRLTVLRTTIVDLRRKPEPKPANDTAAS